MSFPKFDVMVHLTGEQLVPNYMAVKLFDAGRHLLVKTSTTKGKAELLKKIFKGQKEVYTAETDATDFRRIVDDLKAMIGERFADAGSIAFNITGGTKMMSIAAYEVSKEDERITPFYIDTQMRKIHFMKAPFAIEDLPPVFETIDEFFELAGFETQENEDKKGRTVQQVLTDAKRELLELLWSNRVNVHGAQFDFAGIKEFFNKHGYAQALSKVEHLTKALGMKIPGLDGALRRNFPTQNDALAMAEFLGGEWFEEWMLMQFEKCGRYRDIRQSVNVTVREKGRNGYSKDQQELDVVFTDGYTLTIVECKATSDIKQDYMQKLENIQRKLGGVFGCAFLASCFVPQNIRDVEDRVKATPFALVCEKALESFSTKIDDFRRGKVYC